MPKTTCQNMAAMETSSHVDSNMSYQIVADKVLKKKPPSLIAFAFLNRRGQSPPIPSPTPGLNRVKQI